MLQCSKTEVIMKKQGHPAPNGAPNFISLLTGWVQQGVESFFATQQILVDVATRQNVVKTLREGAIDPEHSPLAILTELAMEGTSSFIEAQKILLNLAHQESEIMMNSGKERIAGSARAVAVTDLIRRSLDTFVKMQHDFLTTTSKQTLHWLEAVKAGKGYQDHHLVDFAREGMEIFVQAQKKFLDVIAQETARATSGKPEHTAKTIKKTEFSKLASEATNAFIDAQKRLLDVMGQQTNVNLKAASKTMKLISPTRFLPMANLTGEGVKSFVTAEKALIDSMIKPHKESKVRHHKAVKAKAAHAAA
jgi:hypothetical protein